MIAGRAGLAAALTLLGTAIVTAQQPSLATVLERAGSYVGDFDRQLGGLVVEEHYTQDVFSGGDNGLSMTVNIPGRSSMSGVPRQHRDLKSDVLLVHPIGGSGWVQFRDVYEVDGSTIRGRNDRLAKLVVEPSSSTSTQLRRIAEESARYNIGNLPRTINLPVLPLFFLAPDVQRRFEFSRVLDMPPGKSGDLVVPRDVPKGSAFTVPASAWEVEYKEVGAGTILQTSADRDLPAQGRLWIDPATGRVLMTELMLDDPLVHVALNVGYLPQPFNDVLVPAELREQYVVRATNFHILGAATYANYRRLAINVDEQMNPAR
jgi:hypothetical protein